MRARDEAKPSPDVSPERVPIPLGDEDDFTVVVEKGPRGVRVRSPKRPV